MAHADFFFATFVYVKQHNMPTMRRGARRIMPMRRRIYRRSRAYARAAGTLRNASLRRQIIYADPSVPRTLSGNVPRYLSGANPFPLIKFCDMVYAVQGSMSSTAATSVTGNEVTFRLNSLFDPELSGAGHQPRYYDTLTAVYGNYRVYRVSWEIQIYKPSTTTCFVGMATRNSGDTYTLTSKLFYNCAEPDGALCQWCRDDGTPLVFSGSANVWDLEGLTFRDWQGQDSYQALVSTNPGFSPVLAFALGDAASPGTASTAYYSVKLVYHSKFWALNTPSAS